MAISYKKIFGKEINVQAYCDIFRKKLSDYHIEGIDIFMEYDQREFLTNPVTELSKIAPTNTEAVIGFDVYWINVNETAHSEGLVAYLARGTALIPKKFKNDR